MTRRTAVGIGLVMLFVVGVVVVLIVQHVQNDTDRSRLQDKWKEVVRADDGEAEPTMFAIKNNRIAVIHENQKMEMTCQLSAVRRPKGIDLINLDGPDQDNVKKGIGELSGDSLKMCFNSATLERPSGFHGKPNLVVTMFQRARE